MNSSLPPAPTPTDAVDSFFKQFIDALYHGRAEAVREALARDPGLARRPWRRGQTPLMIAADNGMTECVRELLPHSDLYATDNSHWTALTTAAHMNRPECLTLLLEPHPATHPRGYVERALFKAVSYGSLPCVHLLIPHADLAFTDQTVAADETALMLAARNIRTDCIKALLPGSDPTSPGSDGNTPLMVAAGGTPEHLSAVKLLLPFSNLLARNHAGATALDLAIDAECWNCADLLASRMGADSAQMLHQRAPASRDLPQSRSCLERHALAHELQSVRALSPAPSQLGLLGRRTPTTTNLDTPTTKRSTKRRL